MVYEQFYDALDEWTEHCDNPHIIVSSDSQKFRDCNAYKRIINLGYEALPLIRRTYDMNDTNNLSLKIVKGHGLFAVVKEIVGNEFEIPKEYTGNIVRMSEYTKTWLDKNIGKYVD